MRLFVDCDDTLVLWKNTGAFEKFFSARGLPQNFEINEPLVKAIRTFLTQNKDSVLVVWSGGGKDYAKHWGRTIFPDLGHVPAEKHGTLPLVIKGDIMVDDQPLESNDVHSVTAEEFIGSVMEKKESKKKKEIEQQ